MNRGDVYQGVARWLRVQMQTDASDDLVLLIGGLAVAGVLVIAALWGLPA